MRRGSGPVRIHSEFLKPASLAASQNRTANFVWKKLRKRGSYLIADAVGAGKSYVALSLAFGLWRTLRARRRPFRVLILAGPSELNDSWIQKLVGTPVEQERRIERLAQPQGKYSYFDMYLNREVGRRIPEVVIYHLRYGRDVERLNGAVDEAVADRNKALRRFAPGRKHRNGRIECLVTSPAWAKKVILGRRKRPPWGKWLRSVDVLIADEIFAAKREGTVYGRILRPSLENNRKHVWRRRRPWLIGLSATLLSRDLLDTRDILRLCLDWRKKRDKIFCDEVEQKINEFSKILRVGIRAKATEERSQYLSDYKKVKRRLEEILPGIIVRTPPRQSRRYQFWPGGHDDAQIFSECRDKNGLGSEVFPVENMDFLIKPLQEKFVGARCAVDGLAWFMGQRFRKAEREKTRQDAWTKITESNYKHKSLLEWVKTYYKDHERHWLSRKRKGTFHFKLLIYVHHVKTASDLNPRSRHGNHSIGREFRRELRRLMISTCRKCAKLNPDLFEHGSLAQPTNGLSKVLKRNKWTIEILKKNELTLLLAACINAHKGKTKEEKIARFRKTLEGSEVDRNLLMYRRLLRVNPELRYEILRKLDFERVISFEIELKTRKSKLEFTPTVALLDPDQLQLSKDERSDFLSRLDQGKSDLESVLKNVLAMRTKRVRYRLNEGSVRICETVCNAIEQNRRWHGKIKKFNREPKKIFRRMSRKTSDDHQTPWEIVVQTGQDSKTRNFMAARFRSPGNPFVLALTKVCTVGIDLHTYCWDVLHYTPAWTPHEAEQKTGRIDRPRLTQWAKKLRIAQDKNLHRIHIHYLIWPFTYDERILSRLNLRAQLAERLLGVKQQKTLEDCPSTEVTQRTRCFKPLNLHPS